MPKDDIKAEKSDFHSRVVRDEKMAPNTRGLPAVKIISA